MCRKYENASVQCKYIIFASTNNEGFNNCIRFIRFDGFQQSAAQGLFATRSDLLFDATCFLEDVLRGSNDRTAIYAKKSSGVSALRAFN